MNDGYGLGALLALITILLLSGPLPVVLESEKRKMNIKKGVGLITKLWIANFIIMTTLLWVGYYAEHQGIEWIVTPRNVTLFSSGVIKVVLSIALVTAWINREEGK